MMNHVRRIVPIFLVALTAGIAARGDTETPVASLTLDVYILAASDFLPDMIAVPPVLGGIAEEIARDFDTAVGLVSATSVPCQDKTTVRYTALTGPTTRELGPYVIPSEGEPEVSLKKRMADEKEESKRWVEDATPGASIVIYELDGVEVDLASGEVTIEDVKMAAEVPAVLPLENSVTRLPYAIHREDMTVSPGKILFVGRAGPGSDPMSAQKKTYIEEHPLFIVLAVR